MTSQELSKQIEEIYNEAMTKIAELEKERKQIIADYIKELEAKKVEALRASMDINS